MRLLALAGMLLSSSAPAWSQQDPTSSNYLIPHCRLAAQGTLGTPAAMYCAGLAMGLMQGGGGSMFCQPQGATVSQGLAIIVRYVEQRPELWHEPLHELALVALVSAWPCRR
jgi:hypothetical protein